MTTQDDYDLEDAETVQECERMAQLLPPLTPLMIYALWSFYSESMFAGWLGGLDLMSADEFKGLVMS